MNFGFQSTSPNFFFLYFHFLLHIWNWVQDFELLNREICTSQNLRGLFTYCRFAKLGTCVYKCSGVGTWQIFFISLPFPPLRKHISSSFFFFVPLRRTYKIIIFCSFMSTVNVYPVIYIRFVSLSLYRNAVNIIFNNNNRCRYI